MLDTLAFYIAVPVVLYWAVTWLWERWQLDRLDKRLVLITGCDTGFGYQLVFRCLEAGMPVLAACLTDEGMKRLEEQKPRNASLTTFKLDVRSDVSVADARKIVEKVAAKYGGLHGLVNNAGVVSSAFVDDFLTVEEYKNVMDVNLFGVVRCTHAFIDLIKKVKGRIVTTASICGRVSLPLLGPYTCSKYAVEAYCDTVRIENKVFGISVSIIEPGFFKTPMTTPDRIAAMSEKIWHAATSEKRAEYGDAFFQHCRGQTIEYLAERCNPNTYLVVDAYFHALTSCKPRARYHVGNDSNFLFIPMSFLPAPITDFMFKLVNILKRTPKPISAR